MRAAAIVPARNAAHTLGACLEALRDAARAGHLDAVVVVDDRSTDRTAAVAREYGARVVGGEGRGPAAARNLGARSVEADILLFLDADTAPRAACVPALIAPFDDPTVGAVKGRYATAQRSLVARFAQLEFEEKYERLAAAEEIDFVDTGVAAFRTEPLRAAGGFDEGFATPSAEDVDLGYRLADAGWRIVFAPSAVAEHRHPESLRDFLGRKARYGRYRVVVYRKFPTKAVRDSYTPPTTRPQIILAAAILALAPLFPFGAVPRTLWLGALSIFGLTTLSLVRRSLASDPGLAPFVPALTFVRAAAQGVGLALGIADLVRARRSSGGRDPTID